MGNMMWHNSAVNQGESLSADYQARIDFLLHTLSLYKKKDTAEITSETIIRKRDYVNCCLRSFFVPGKQTN